MTTISVMTQERFDEWTKYAEKVSIALSNLENMRRILEKECPPSEIDAPDVPNVDLSDLVTTINIKIKELTESYIAIKDRIRESLKQASPEFQEKHRIWMA